MLATALALLFTLGAAPTNPSPQTNADAVARLVSDLGADDESKRTSARRELLDLGPEILSHLPNPMQRSLNEHQREALRAILAQLVQQHAIEQVRGKRITFDERTLFLPKAIEVLRQQSGIAVAPPGGPNDAPNASPTVTMPAGPITFFEALDALCSQAHLGFNPRIDEPGFQLVHGSGSKTPVHYAGAYRLAIDSLSLETVFNVPTPTSNCVFDVRILHEPTQKPILAQVGKLSYEDDKGRRVALPSEQGFVVKPGSSAMDFSARWRMPAPPRDAREIRQLDGELEVWLPAWQSVLEFDELASGRRMARSDVAVRSALDPVTIQDGIWTARLTADDDLARLQPRESHLQADVRIDVHLRALNGSRIEPAGGTNLISQDGRRVVIEFLFLDVPGQPSDYRLIANIPAGLVRVPVPFQFRDVPLP